MEGADGEAEDQVPAVETFFSPLFSLCQAKQFFKSNSNSRLRWKRTKVQ